MLKTNKYFNRPQYNVIVKRDSMKRRRDDITQLRPVLLYIIQNLVFPTPGGEDLIYN